MDLLFEVAPSTPQANPHIACYSTGFLSIHQSPPMMPSKSIMPSSLAQDRVNISKWPELHGLEKKRKIEQRSFLPFPPQAAM